MIDPAFSLMWRRPGIVNAKGHLRQATAEQSKRQLSGTAMPVLSMIRQDQPCAEQHFEATPAFLDDVAFSSAWTVLRRYRGAVNYQSSNRLTFLRVPIWRASLTKATLSIGNVTPT